MSKNNKTPNILRLLALKKREPRQKSWFSFYVSWEQRKVAELFKVTRGYVLATSFTSETQTDEKPYPVYSSQTKDNGLMGYYKDYLYENAITWTTDGANAGTVNFRAGKFYCTNVCGVLLANKVEPNQMIAEALNNVAKGYVSYVGNPKLMNNVMAEIEISLPVEEKERKRISALFNRIDNLITLHQRKGKHEFQCDFSSFLLLKKANYWEQREFGYYFDERNERSGEGEMISVTINSGIKKFNELNRFDTKPEDLSKYKRVLVGDIAYNSMRMWQGASGYSPYNGILSPAYTVITPKNGVSSRFFAYVLKRPRMIHLFEINSQGLTKDTWNLKFPAFSPIPVCAPKSELEQKTIAKILQSVDDLITLHQCKGKTALSLINFEIEKQNHQKTSITWEQRKLGDVGKARSGIGFPDSEQGGTVGIPFFKVSDMNTEGNEKEMTVANNYVTDDQIVSRKWSPIEELPAIFFAKVGAAVMLNRKRLCRVPFLLDNNTMAYSLSKDWWDANFAKALFETVDLTSLVQVGALPSYNAGDVEGMGVLLPKLLEQEKIGAYFKNLDDLITLHQCKESIKTGKSDRWSKNRIDQKRSITWEQRKLGDTVSLRGRIGFRGYTQSDLVEEGNGAITFSPADIDESGNVSQTNNKYISWIKYEESPEIKVKEGDILFTKTASIGKVGFIRELTEKATINPQFALLTPKKGTDGYFTFLSIRNENFMNQVRDITGGSSVPTMSQEKLKELSFMTSTLGEQEKIGGFFGKVDNLITLHQCKELRSEEIKNIKISPFSNLQKCHSWEQRKLGEVAQIVMGQSPDGSTYSDTPSVYILVQGNADLENGWVKPRVWTTQKTKYANAGDLIMSVRAPAGSMGKTAYNVVLGRGVAAIKGNEYIFQMLVKMDGNGYWKKLSAGSTFESLNSDTIYNAEFYLPCLNEQNVIGNFLQKIDNLITLHQRGGYYYKRSLLWLKQQKKRNYFVTILNAGSKCTKMVQFVRLL